MAKLFPAEMTDNTLTSEKVFITLVELELDAHMAHLNTKSYAQHKALDELYSGIQGFRDTIMENIIGQTGNVLMPVKTVPLSNCDAKACAAGTIMFATRLRDWADSKGWTDLANIADELRALGVKVNYLLTLS